MGKTVRSGWLVVLASVCVGLASSSASAAFNYDMSLLSGGADQVTVGPGDTLTVDLILGTTDALTEHDGNDLLVSISHDGFDLSSFNWMSPFVTGGASDYTRVAPSPAPSGNGLLGTLPQPVTNAFGIKFGANTDQYGDLFGTGTLLSFDLAVPASYAGEVVTLDVSGSFTEFVNTYEDWVGTSTGPLTLVPEPATLMLLGLGGLAVLRRRRPA